MDLEALGDIGLDLIEELAELGRPMTAAAFKASSIAFCASPLLIAPHQPLPI
jgi:hypothetical protein